MTLNKLFEQILDSAEQDKQIGKLSFMEDFIFDFCQKLGEFGEGLKSPKEQKEISAFRKNILNDMAAFAEYQANEDPREQNPSNPFLDFENEDDLSSLQESAMYCLDYVNDNYEGFLGEEPTKFRDFVEHYQQKCLAYVLGQSQRKQRDKFAVFVHFQEILPLPSKSKTPASKLNDAGMILSFVLVDMETCEIIDVIGGDFLEYPPTLPSSSGPFISELAKKEIREKLWSAAIKDLYSVSKRPRINYSFVFDPSDTMETMFRDIQQGQNKGILCIDNNSDDLNNYPFVKNVRRYLDQNVSETSFHSCLGQNDDDLRRNKFFVTLSEQKMALLQPLEFDVSFGALPPMEQLFSATDEVPQTICASDGGAKAASKPQLKNQREPKGEKNKKQNPMPLFFVHIRQTSAVSEGVKPIDRVFCVTDQSLDVKKAEAIIRIGAFHWINDQFPYALHAARKVAKCYTMDYEGDVRLGFLCASIPRLQQIQFRSATIPEVEARSIEIESTICALEEIMAEKDKNFKLKTCRDFYIALAKAGGYKETKKNAAIFWSDLWKGWGTLSNNIQESAMEEYANKFSELSQMEELFLNGEDFNESDPDDDDSEAYKYLDIFDDHSDDGNSDDGNSQGRSSKTGNSKKRGK